MGMIFDDHLYISTSNYGEAYIFERLEIEFNMRQLPESACAIIFSLNSYHMGVH